MSESQFFLVLFFFFLVKPSEVSSFLPILEKYRSVQESQSLLQIGFTTLSDYLWMLRTACEFLAELDSHAMLYLAAAVSDFYVPAQQMVSIDA